MQHRIGGEEGFGLAAAVLALVVIGALVTGGFVAASNEGQIGVSSRFSAAAFYAAERGIDDLLGTRTRLYFESIPVGQQDQLAPVTLNAGGLETRYTVTVRRLDDHLFMVQSTGEVLSGGRYAGATRHLARMVRLTNFSLVVDHAVKTAGGWRMRGQSGVSGNDTIPPGWTDCTDLGARTGILATDTTQIDLPPGQGGGQGQGLQGNPPKAEDETMGYDDFFDFGDVDYDQLAAMAEHVFPGGTTLSNIGPSLTAGGGCNFADDRNWGDPTDAASPCHFHFPIIYVDGDLQMGGGGGTSRGQGILLVDGDLHMSGNFEFYGSVIVKGRFVATGTGNRIRGSVSAWADTDHQLNPGGSGNTRIQLSTCALDRASRYNPRVARAFPLHERSWIDLSGSGWSN